MIIDFKNLSIREYELLLKFPAYVSLLAANSDGELDDDEELAAIHFTHVKTYSSDPLLIDFFKEVDNSFERTLHELNNSLPEGKVNRDAIIKSKLLNIEKIVLKLGPENAAIVHKSMKSFKEHISRAHHNVLFDFLFPIVIPGLSEH
jgi:hypothetical protein